MLHEYIDLCESNNDMIQLGRTGLSHKMASEKSD